MTLLVNRLLGTLADPWLGEAVHRLEHRGAVETVTLPRADLARRRLRLRTDRGSDLAIALPREVALVDRAVLLLDPDRAVILRVEAENWLRLRPRDGAEALSLGYFAGNLHWRARFEGGDLLVAVEHPLATYLERLRDRLAEGRVQQVEQAAR